MKPWEVAAQQSATSNKPWARATAQETERTEKAARREAAPAKAREAYEASRNSPESVAARERDAQHPIQQYLGDWAGQVGDAFSDVYDDYNPLKAAVGSVDAAASLGTSVLAPLFGAADVTASNLGFRDKKNPQNSYATARDKYVYQPRSEVGQDIVNAAGAVLKPAGDLFSEAGEQAGEGVESMGGSEADATAAREIVPDILGFAAEAPAARPAMKAAKSGIENVMPEPRASLRPGPRAPGSDIAPPAQSPAQTARAAGMVLPPSAAPDARGSFLETTVGQSQAQARAALRNQPTINRHAAAELGLKGPQRFSEQTFRNLEKAPSMVYDEVRNSVPAIVLDNELQAAIGGIGDAQRKNPLLEVGPAVEALQQRLSKQDGTIKTADVMEAIREWRFKAQKLYQSMDDPAKHEQANAFQSAADSFEDAIERQAAAAGKGDLGDRFRAARREFAKIYDYETAMVDGNIDVSVLNRMKDKGRKLSGRASMLADLGRWFEPETKTATMVRLPERTNVPLWRIMIGRGAQMLARRPVDDILFSDMVQSQFGDVDAAPGPGSPLGAYFDAPKPPPPAPKPPTPEGAGVVDFERSPEVPPAAALRNEPRPGSREFARDESGDAAIPPAEGRLGDLTASTPPAPEGLPFEASPEVANVQGRPRPDAADADLAGDQGFFPGAEVPPNAAMTEFVSDQPISRRREGGRPLVEGPIPPFAGNSTRAFIDDGNPATAPGRPGDPDALELAPEYPVPDRSAERARVLAGDTFDADMMIGDLIERFPGLMDELRGDTVANREVIMNRRVTDQGGQAPARTASTPSRRGEDPRDINPARGLRKRPQSADEAAAAEAREEVDIAKQEGMPVDDAAIQQTRETLAELGFTPEEIDEILSRGGE